MNLNNLSRKRIWAMTGLILMAILTSILIYYTTSLYLETTSFNVNCSNPVANSQNSSLKLVHIVFRHGARTPVNTYPNDPYVNDSFYPIGWGHVTNKGKRELYNLGKALFKRYGSFLGPIYSPDQVHAQSTASPRALMSLSTVLASMFPPQGTDMEWSHSLNWQPIPIFSEPLEDDSLLLVRTPCPRYSEALKEVLELPEVKEELEQYLSLFNNLTEITGTQVRSADDVNSIYITLQAEKEFGLDLPLWTKHYFPKKMQFLAEQSYIYNTYTTEMRKIKGGPFLKKMFNEMVEKRSESLVPHNRKLFIYAGHDWTIGNILSALNVWTRQMPRFSIMTIFELHQNHQSGEYYVKIFLRNNGNECLQELTVPDCTHPCLLDDLIALCQTVLPNETYEERCKARHNSFAEPPPRSIDQV